MGWLSRRREAASTKAYEETIEKATREKRGVLDSNKKESEVSKENDKKGEGKKS